VTREAGRTEIGERIGREMGKGYLGFWIACRCEIFDALLTDRVGHAWEA